MNVNEIISGTVSNVLAGIILALLALVVLDEKRVLKPWIYKFLQPIVGQSIQLLLNFIKLIVHPILRILWIGLFLLLLNLGNNHFLYSFLILLITLSFLIEPKFGLRFSPNPKLSDGFNNLAKWEIKTGAPEIEKDFGRPAPGLGLKVTLQRGTHSFIILKNIEQEKGIIECDFYLEPNAVFNIVFYCDKQNDNWFMARYDSRKSDSDGFLIKDRGPGVNWRFYRMSGTQTNTKTWLRARLEFSSTRASMYRDGELIAQIDNPTQFGKFIGLFNEVQHVHVDNFALIEDVNI